MEEEERKLLQAIATLEDEHRALDAMIAGERSLDRLQVQRMKKRKLWLKDEIARLYGVLHPDIIA
jgi:hypothetical protein